MGGACGGGGGGVGGCWLLPVRMWQDDVANPVAFQAPPASCTMQLFDRQPFLLPLFPTTPTPAPSLHAARWTATSPSGGGSRHTRWAGTWPACSPPPGSSLWWSPPSPGPWRPQLESSESTPAWRQQQQRQQQQQQERQQQQARLGSSRRSRPMAARRRCSYSWRQRWVGALAGRGGVRPSLKGAGGLCRTTAGSAMWQPCLQTALPPSCSPPHALSPLSLLQTAESDVRVAHGALALRPGVRVLANELCRERLGAPVDAQLAWQTWPGLAWPGQAAGGLPPPGLHAAAALSADWRCKAAGTAPLSPAVQPHPTLPAGPSQCDKRRPVSVVQQEFPGRTAAPPPVPPHGLPVCPAPSCADAIAWLLTYWRASLEAAASVLIG